MLSSNALRRKADEALVRARDESDPDARSDLYDLAIAYLRLGAQAEQRRLDALPGPRIGGR